MFTSPLEGQSPGLVCISEDSYISQNGFNFFSVERDSLKALYREHNLY